MIVPNLAIKILKNYKSFDESAPQIFSNCAECFNGNKLAALKGLKACEALIYDEDTKEIIPENKEFIQELLKKDENLQWNLDFIVRELSEYKEDGVFPDDFKQKMLQAVDLKVPFQYFDYCYEFYQNNSKNNEHDDEIFKLVQNHHWLEEFGNSPDKEKTAKKLAFEFRRVNDF